MQVSHSTNHSNTQQSDMLKAQKQQEVQAQKDQVQQNRDAENRLQEAAKLTGLGQNLDISS